MWSKMGCTSRGWLFLVTYLLTAYHPANSEMPRKYESVYIADPVGIPLSKPSNIPDKVGSPAALIQPDRYEFYTFDESGELIKRLMTLEEIQEIIATGDSDDGHVLTIAQSDINKPAVTFNFQPPSNTKVHSIVSNVQNVLKSEMEAQKNNPPKEGMFDTPDVSSSWSQILPAIFGNTGGSIAPDSLLSPHVGPETDFINLDKEEIPISQNDNKVYYENQFVTQKPIYSKPAVNPAVDSYNPTQDLFETDLQSKTTLEENPNYSTKAASTQESSTTSKYKNPTTTTQYSTKDNIKYTSPTTVKLHTTTKPSTAEIRPTPRPTTQKLHTTVKPTTSKLQTTVKLTTVKLQTTVKPSTEKLQTTAKPTPEKLQTAKPTTEKLQTAKPTTEKLQTTKPTTENIQTTIKLVTEKLQTAATQTTSKIQVTKPIKGELKTTAKPITAVETKPMSLELISTTVKSQTTKPTTVKVQAATKPNNVQPPTTTKATPRPTQYEPVISTKSPGSFKQNSTTVLNTNTKETTQGTTATPTVTDKRNVTSGNIQFTLSSRPSSTVKIVPTLQITTAKPLSPNKASSSTIVIPQTHQASTITTDKVTTESVKYRPSESGTTTLLTSHTSRPTTLQTEFSSSVTFKPTLTTKIQIKDQFADKTKTTQQIVPLYERNATFTTSKPYVNIRNLTSESSVTEPSKSKISTTQSFYSQTEKASEKPYYTTQTEPELIKISSSNTPQPVPPSKTASYSPSTQNSNRPSTNVFKTTTTEKIAISTTPYKSQFSSTEKYTKPDIDINQIINQIALNLGNTQKYEKPDAIEATHIPIIFTHNVLKDAVTTYHPYVKDNYDDSKPASSNVPEVSRFPPIKVTQPPVANTIKQSMNDVTKHPTATPVFTKHTIHVTTDRTLDNKYPQNPMESQSNDLSDSITNLLSQISNPKPTMVPISQNKRPVLIPNDTKIYSTTENFINQEINNLNKQPSPSKPAPSTELPIKFAPTISSTKVVDSTTYNVVKQNIDKRTTVKQPSVTESNIKSTQKINVQSNTKPAADNVNQSTTGHYITKTSSSPVVSTNKFQIYKTTNEPTSTTIKKILTPEISTQKNAERLPISTLHTDKINVHDKEQPLKIDLLPSHEAQYDNEKLEEFEEPSENSDDGNEDSVYDGSDTTGAAHDDELMEMLNKYSEMFNSSPDMESKSGETDDVGIPLFESSKKGTSYKKTDLPEDDFYQFVNISQIPISVIKSNKTDEKHDNKDLGDINNEKQNENISPTESKEKKTTTQRSVNKSTEYQVKPTVNENKKSTKQNNTEPLLTTIKENIETLPVTEVLSTSPILLTTTSTEETIIKIINSTVPKIDTLNLKNTSADFVTTEANIKNQNEKADGAIIQQVPQYLQENKVIQGSSSSEGSSTETTNIKTVEKEATANNVHQSEKEATTNMPNVHQNEKEATTNRLNVHQNEKEGIANKPNVHQNEKEATASSPNVHQNEKEATASSPNVHQNEKEVTASSPNVHQNEKEVTASSPNVHQSEKEAINSWTLVSTASPQNNQNKVEIANKVENRPQTHLIGQLHLSTEGEGLEKTTAGLSEDVYQFARLCNELGFRYWKAIVSAGIDPKRSVFASPFAITSLLAMIFMATRGATSEEMNEILKLDDMVTFNPHIVFKNVTESIEVSQRAGVATSAIIRELYSDKSKGRLLSFYKERVQKFYSGHVEEINFGLIGDIVRRRTNLLVKRQTWNKIPEYIKQNNLVMRPPLAVFSTNIFQTDCSAASTEGRDGEMYFVVSPTIRQRRLVPVPAVVYRSGFLAGYVIGLDATAVAIGNGDQIVSTIFLMPGQQGSIARGDDIIDLEKRFMNSVNDDNTWKSILKSLVPRTGLELQIPRLSHRSVINGTLSLQTLGVKDLFDSKKANLAGLNGQDNDLHLSDMIMDNTFSTCGEGMIGEQHHVETYPGESYKLQRRLWRTPTRPLYSGELGDSWDDYKDYQRAFHDPLHDMSLLSIPLHLRPRQARLPDQIVEPPRLKFDRPFMYFVRHNPTGLILHMGRYNPRLLP